jgi:hypothetical protein
MYLGSRTAEVERISWAKDTVWLDKAQTRGFKGVPEEAWHFQIGSYQVCEKWLKDRRGRALSNDDIAHYQKIVVAVAQTIHLMKEIDKAIEQYGGWPGAFEVASVKGEKQQLREVADPRAEYEIGEETSESRG